MMNVIYFKEKCKSKSAKVMQDLMTNDNSKKSKKNPSHSNSNLWKNHKVCRKTREISTHRGKKIVSK